MLTDFDVFCADIGSVARNRFGWAASPAAAAVEENVRIEDLVTALVGRLDAGRKVALGFECPLFVPVSVDAKGLTSARNGEGSRPWSAGAGCGALATGLVESVWILSQTYAGCADPPPVFLDWQAFATASRGLFVWEAFVTGDAKAHSHSSDAAAAVREFRRVCQDPESANAIKSDAVFSLIGAALLRSGWSKEISLLSRACIVIKPQIVATPAPATPAPASIR